MIVSNPISLERKFLKELLERREINFLVCWQMRRKSDETAENYLAFEQPKMVYKECRRGPLVSFLLYIYVYARIEQVTNQFCF